MLQEVGSIIGKKGEIVKRFREEVSRQISHTHTHTTQPSRKFTPILNYLNRLIDSRCRCRRKHIFGLKDCVHTVN